jgi:hypothetical protein
MNGSDKDRWIHLLMDADLTADQRSELEKRLRSNPEDLSDFECEKMIHAYFQEIGKEVPAVANHPDFLWSQVKARIEKEGDDRKAQSRVGWNAIFSFPRFALSFAAVALIFGIVLYRSHPTPQQTVMVAENSVNNNNSQNTKTEPKSTYDTIRQVQTSSDLNATTYDSKSGNATVVWVSGALDNSPSQFGEILEVHSYSPEVSATTYNSDSGNATVIWVSGMDYQGESQKTAVF